MADISKGEHVLRYGQINGKAIHDILKGSHVHDHNMDMSSNNVDYAFSTAADPLPSVLQDRTFKGYHRANGRVGTRNYIGMLT